LDRAFKELSPQIDAKKIVQPNFLKYFIPCDRKDLIKIPWLHTYIIRSLKKRSMPSNIKTPN